MGSVNNLSMDVFFKFMDKKLADNITMEELLSEIVSNHVVMQHIFVATAKLSWYENDTFRFSNDEGALRWLDTISPQLNGTKFLNTINILMDLDLVHGEAKELTLTKEGKKILSQI